MTSPNCGNVRSKFSGKRCKRKLSTRLENALDEKKENSSEKDTFGSNVHNSCSDEAKTDDFLRRLVHEQKLNAPTLFCNENKPVSPSNKFDSHEEDEETVRKKCKPDAPSSDNEHQMQDDSSSSSSNQFSKNRSSGKLRFYLDGRFVLELVHSSGEKTNCWTQSRGEIWTPAPVKREELVKADSSVDNVFRNKSKRSTSLLVSTSSPLLSSLPPSTPSVSTEKSNNVSLFTMRVNRNLNWLPQVSVKHLRKAARNPTLNLNLVCLTEPKKQTAVLPRKKPVRKIKTLEKCFESSKFFNHFKVEKNFNVNQYNNIFEISGKKFKIEYPLKQNEESEVAGSNNRRPLPDWYLDPSKAQVPLSEMIGYPRPYFPNNVQSTGKQSGSISGTKSFTENETKDDSWKSDEKSNFLESLEISEAIFDHLIADIESLVGDSKMRYVPDEVLSEVAAKYKIKVSTAENCWLHRHKIHSNHTYMSNNNENNSSTVEENHDSTGYGSLIKEEPFSTPDDVPLDLSVHKRNAHNHESNSNLNGPHSGVDQIKWNEEHSQNTNVRRQECSGSCDCARARENSGDKSTSTYSTPHPSQPTPPPPLPPSVALSPWPLVAYAPTVVNSYYYCCCFLPDCPRFNCNAENSSMQSTTVLPPYRYSKCSTIANGKTCSCEESDLKLPSETDSSERTSSMLKELLLKPSDE